MDSLVRPISLANHLTCSACNSLYALDKLQNFSPCCQKPFLVNYDLSDRPALKEIASENSSMWRYATVLPVFNPLNIVSLGEGMTPIFDLQRLASKHGLKSLKVKDEGLNPTGSFKARGLSAAVSKAKELGVEHCVIPTAGNAGGAMSAYCAAAGIKATVVMPDHTPKSFQHECEHYGARLLLANGLIDKCAILAAKIQQEEKAFNVSTLKEPYRLEGKKTMGYEIAEQLNWNLPDVILYPTGGGTGLIGIWKAFHEMITLGWLKPEIKLPRMITVQASKCAPVVDFLSGIKREASYYSESIANGLAVPHAFGMDLISKVVKESKGMGITVTDDEMIEGVREVAQEEGILMAPEGAALWKALGLLIDRGEVLREESVLMINTGSGYKYLENFS